MVIIYISLECINVVAYTVNIVISEYALNAASFHNNGFLVRHSLALQLANWCDDTTNEIENVIASVLLRALPKWSEQQLNKNALMAMARCFFSASNAEIMHFSRF